MKSNTRTLILCFCISLLVSIAACGILNLGPTNEDGSPKTEADARLLLRSIGDAGIQTWGTEAIKKQAPQLMPVFDKDGNGVLTLAEIEGAVNVADERSLTALLVLAIEMYRARP